MTDSGRVRVEAAFDLPVCRRGRDQRWEASKAHRTVGGPPGLVNDEMRRNKTFFSFRTIDKNRLGPSFESIAAKHADHKTADMKFARKIREARPAPRRISNAGNSGDVSRGEWGSLHVEDCQASRTAGRAYSDQCRLLPRNIASRSNRQLARGRSHR
jgi:hypothetical protein